MFFKLHWFRYWVAKKDSNDIRFEVKWKKDVQDIPYLLEAHMDQARNLFIDVTRELSEEEKGEVMNFLHEKFWVMGEETNIEERILREMKYPGRRIIELLLIALKYQRLRDELIKKLLMIIATYNETINAIVKK